METPEYPYFILLIDFFSWRIIALQCGGGLCCTSTQKKLGIKLPQDPAIPLMQINPKEKNGKEQKNVIKYTVTG